jgi:hypothetical protein
MLLYKTRGFASNAGPSTCIYLNLGEKSNSTFLLIQFRQADCELMVLFRKCNVRVVCMNIMSIHFASEGLIVFQNVY